MLISDFIVKDSFKSVDFDQVSEKEWSKLESEFEENESAVQVTTITALSNNSIERKRFEIFIKNIIIINGKTPIQ